MKKINAWLVILASILLGLHAANVFNLLEGSGAWILAVVVFLIGLNKLFRD